MTIFDIAKCAIIGYLTASCIAFIIFHNTFSVLYSRVKPSSRLRSSIDVSALVGFSAVAILGFRESLYFIPWKWQNTAGDSVREIIAIILGVAVVIAAFSILFRKEELQLTIYELKYKAKYKEHYSFIKESSLKKQKDQKQKWCTDRLNLLKSSAVITPDMTGIISEEDRVIEMAVLEDILKDIERQDG